MPFNGNNALETIQLMAGLLSLRINRSMVEQVTVDVQEVQLANSSAEDKRIAKSLKDAIVQTIVQSDGFVLQDSNNGASRDKAGYTLRTTLTLTKKHTPPLFLPETSGASADVSIFAGDVLLWKGNKSFDVAQRGSGNLNDKWTLFYSDIADLTLQGLNNARTAPSMSFKQNLVNVSDDDLVQKTNEMLCVNVTAGCQAGGQAAVPLAAELVRRHPQEFGAVELLGKAQYGAGLYFDAAVSFEKASTLAVGQVPDRTINFHTEAGDAWYHCQDFEKAADSYKGALDGFSLIKTPLTSNLADQLSTIRLQYARSIRYGGDRKAAFKSLSDSVRVVKNTGPFNSELRELITSMQPEELIWAESQIGSGEQGGLDPNVRVGLYDLIAERYLVNISDINKAGEYLGKAEAVPTKDLEPGVQAMTLLWRGDWYLVQDKWESAESVLEKAMQLDANPVIRYELSTCYYLWAREEMSQRKVSQGAEHPSAESPMSEQEAAHWRAAADAARPILINSELDPANKMFYFVERIYRNANHNVGNDAESKANYQEILMTHPDNSVVLMGFMSLCTDFLLHDPCALDAATRADAAGSASDLGSVLDIAEVYVQNGEYDKGIRKIQSLPPSLNDNPLGYGAVAHFYETWAYLAKGDLESAAKSKAAWDADIALFWKQHSVKSDFNWVFFGALKALDEEKNVPDRYISTLRGMIVAMGDPKALRPNLPQ